MPSTGPFFAGQAGKTHAGITTKMTASFGTPAPLPGQPGFGTTTSDVMERETAEMEERLAKLKDDLSAEAEARESASKVGGSRWRSARVDRGSVRAYANDVKLRHQYRLQRRPPHGVSSSRGGRGHGTVAAGLGEIINPQAGAGARAAAALRERDEYQRHRRRLKAAGGGDTCSIKDLTMVGALQTEVNMSFSEQKSSSGSGGRCYAEKDVAQWSVDDTLQWLDGSLGLSKYRGVFQQNEISGPILLEVGLDDLDYMKVHILAHRKLILSGIEELRRRSDDGGGHTADVPPPAPAQRRSEVGGVRGVVDGGKEHGNPGKSGGVTTSAIQDGGVHHQLPAGQIKMQHWSHVTPLSDDQINDADETTGSPNKRLADGEYDEQAAHSSFAAAVAAWRSGAGGSAGDQQQDRLNSTVAPHSSPRKSSSVDTISRAPASGNPAQSAPRTSHQLSGQRYGNTTNQLRTITPRSYTATGLLGVRNGNGHSECWVNPFATPPDSRDGTDECSIANSAQNAVYEELGGDGEMVIFPSPSRRPRASMTVPEEGRAKVSPVVSTAVVSEKKGCTSCDLGDGDDDGDDEKEAKRQHAAFKRAVVAVADWNNSSGNDEGIGNKRKSGSTISPPKQKGELCDPGYSSSNKLRMAAGDEGPTDAAPVSLSGGVETPRRVADALAESLREQMDAEHREVARKMEQTKLALLEGLNDVERGHGGRKSRTKMDVQYGDDHESRSCSDEKSDHQEDYDFRQDGKYPGEDNVEVTSRKGWRWREKHEEVAWGEGGDRGKTQFNKERGLSSRPGGGEGKRDNSSDSDDDLGSFSLRSGGSRRCSGSGDDSPRSDRGFEAEDLGTAENPGGSVVEIEFVESVLGSAPGDVLIDGREELTEYLVEEG